MPAIQPKNYAQTTLSVAALSTDTVLSVTSVSGWPTTGNFALRIDDPAPLTTFEYVLVTSVNVGGNQVTVTRGQEGTSAIAHPVNAIVGNDFSAAMLTTGFTRLDTAASQTMTGPLVIPYAVAAATNPATSYGTFPVKIDDILVGTDSRYPSATSQITFLNTSNSGTNLLPTGFRHLRFDWYARQDSTNGDVDLDLRFNNDSGTNYDAQRGFTSNSTTWTTDEQLASTFLRIGQIPGASATAGYFGQGRCEINYYQNTVGVKFQMSQCSWGSSTGTGVAARVMVTSGKWRTSGTAITRIDLLSNISGTGGNFVAGSLFTLYGIP